MITLKLTFFRQTQAGQAEGCHNVSTANKQFLCCVVDRSYDTILRKCYSTKNRTASLDKGTRSCNLQFLEPEKPLPHWKKHFGSLTKTYFLQAVAKFCLFSLPVRSCPAMKYITTGTMRSLGAVTPLGCLWPENKKIPIFKALSGTFSTTQISRHVRVS